MKKDEFKASFLRTADAAQVPGFGSGVDELVKVWMF